MEDSSDFTATLRAFMARARRNNSDLAQLTGLSINTIEKWTSGGVRRPRYVADVLTLARALALDAADAGALLLVAGHPPLATLHAQAAQSGDSALRALLTAWPPAAAHEPAGAAAAPATSPYATPHQLRAPVADFVGRVREIEQLVSALRRALAEQRGAILGGVQGMGGIGKTELAYAIAHQLRDAFPDAQIVLNLRGSSPNPLTPEQTLQAIIHTLNPASSQPDDLPALEQHYRTLLHNSRVLILADDARDAAQVQGLLPPAGSAVLITSRQRFCLPGMSVVQLEQLHDDEAVRLLRAICPRLSEAEALQIARACGHLPLALRISGSILHSTPALSAATYIAQLGDERQRLRALRDPDDGQLDVTASLHLGYDQLDAATQRTFRQIGVFVADFTAALAQAVVEAPDETEVEAMLHSLLRRNLLLYDAEHNRWRLHDLLRDLARRYLEEMGEDEATWWRYAHAAVRMAEETQEQYEAGGEAALAALARFDAERSHIDATWRWAVEQAGTESGDRLLVDGAIATRRIGRMRYDRRRESIPLWERALAAARRLGDRRTEWLALNNQGNAYSGLGETRPALHYYEQALSIVRALSDRHREGITLINLGLAYMELGQARRAIPAYEQALTILRAIGDRRNESIVLGNLGNAYTDLGRVRRAIEFCEAALTIACDIGDQLTEGYALSYLARAQARQGDLARAAATFEQAIALFHEVGEHWGEAECNWQVGLALAEQGAQERALPLLRAAVAYEREIGHAKADEHAAMLAELEAQQKPFECDQNSREVSGAGLRPAPETAFSTSPGAVQPDAKDSSLASSA